MERGGGGSGVATGALLGAVLGFLCSDLDLPSLVSYWGDRIPIVLGCAVAGALAGAWSPLRRTLAAVTLGAALVWLTVVSTPLAHGLAEGFTRRDPLKKADAIFVFSSRVFKDGDLTSASLTRLTHALELLGEGYSEHLVLSELAPPEPSYGVPARALMAHLQLKEELLTVGPVQNTHDEGAAVAALCRERGWRSVIAVTSPLHSRRASAVLEAQGLEVISSPCMETRYDLVSLDRGEERLLAFGNLLHERAGLLAYARRGWIR